MTFTENNGFFVFFFLLKFSIKIVEDHATLKSPDADDQVKVDGSEENIEKMEVETSVLFTPSEVKQQPRRDQHLNFIASTKIEHRRADAPEYFPGCDIPVYHKVNFTICLSFAMFSKQFASSIHSLDKKQKSEALTALGYYHTEFRLLPTDDEPTQIDIVPYPYFARVFADKYETKTVKYYHDADTDDGESRKQVNFQKEWLKQEEKITLTSESNTPIDGQTSSKLKDESSLNILSNERFEVQLDSSKRKFSTISLIKTDVQLSHNKKTSVQKEIPIAKVSLKLRYFFSDVILQIYFNDINVILTGNIDQMELREFFLGSGLVIEIHDRDRKPSKTIPPPLLFGDDLNDEKFNNIGVITSKKTKINPYKTPPANSLDPFGVAHFDLSGFTLGQKFSYQELPIHNSPTLASLQNAENMNFVKKVNSDSNKENGPFKPGHYIHSCAMLNVTIKLTYPLIIPLVTNPRAPITATYNCPFGRMVFRIGAGRQKFLEDVLITIARVNGQALGLNDVPDNILIATLLTLITTRHQRFDRLLDIITGFHIIDESMHLLVVEGLQNQGIKTLIDRFGDTDLPEVKILFNTDLICSDRLYASFDVILRKVKLHESLDSIVQQPLIYIRDMVPRPCYDALIQIHELSKCSRLIDAIRNQFFPNANMVRSLSKEFGIVIKEEHFKTGASATYQEDNKPQVSLLDTLATAITDQYDNKSKCIDHYNKPYVRLLKRNLHSAPADLIARNISLVNSASNKLKAMKEPENTVSLPFPLKEVHNYGMSTYNTVELKKLELRREMDPKSLYTYCPDFHHSMTFAPMELEQLYKQEEICKKDKWTTPNGWVYPGFKSAVDNYVHPKKPSSARLKELSQPYEETLRLERRDPRERCAFTWSERNLDMNLWSCPTTDPGEKVYVLHNPGDQEAIIKENHEKEAENWKSKVVVKNIRTRFHRQLTETELQMQGQRASCQLDRMKGLLKDKPIRRTFKYCPVADMTSLGVINYPELSVNSANRKLLRSYDGDNQKSAYVPGPYWPERSLALIGNHTLTQDYEHKKFATLKGKDFKSLHKRHDSIYKRKHPVLPVREEEKHTHYGNLKNCFCRSHTVPEIWQQQIFHCSAPPHTADPK
ncbi:unnamed protein product [Acanthosepion pharaonis]|uniref:DUF4550 domain-containing protein n=1 Tax=Acanthosepion pharaonis TaxID=158019 RepID=A0A812D044_ACAPH|nr:unnamed protein product [Sepia pharaonis]